MNPEGLKAFIKVSQLKSFSKAAVEMGLSQPRLSYTIGRLEEDLQTTLFARTSRGVQLTSEGEIFAERAQHLLNLWSELTAQLTNKKALVRWQLVLGAHPEVAAYTFPLFMPNILERFPEMNLIIKLGLSREINQQVIDRKVDLGIVINPLPQSDLVIKEIGHDEFTLWQQKNNLNQQTVFFDPNLAQSQWMLRNVKPHTFSRFIECSNLAVIRSLTESGAGVGILPARVACDLERFCPNAPVYLDKICLVYMQSFKSKPTAAVLISLIKEGFSLEKRSMS